MKNKLEILKQRFIHADTEKERLKEVLPLISISYITKIYFNKSRHWFYQKLNGNIVNGKPARFTPEEIEALNFALKDVSRKLAAI